MVGSFNSTTFVGLHWLGAIVCSTALTSIVVAQQPPAEATTQPTTSPTTAPARNGNGVDHIQAENGRLVLNFRDASIDLVLDELSAAAGFVVVKEVKPQGRVTLTSRQPLTPDDAVALLNTVLHNAGYSAIQQGRILKIVPRDVAKRLNIPVHSGADPAAIEPTDELRTQVIPLRYADATQLKTDLQPVVNPQADFTANASSNALVITDTAANVRRIVQIVRALDTSLADAIDVKVFQLKFANAATAAQLINSVFGELEVAVDPNEDPRSRWRRMQQQQQQQQQQGGQRNTKVNAAADERTNSVVVTGPTDTLTVVAEVMKELDANPAADETVFVYRLRNAQAANVESVLNNLFGITSALGIRQNQQQQTPQQILQQYRNNVRGSGTGGIGMTGGRTGGGGIFGGGSGFGGGGGGFGGFGQGRFGTFGQGQFGGGGGAAARLSAAAQQAVSDLSGQVTLIADIDTNSLLVRTSPANYERVRQVLEEIDRPVAQVLIKVLIAEVTHDDSLDLGTEFSVLNLRNGNSQEAGTNFNIPTEGASATGLVVQIVDAGDFTATIRALETQGKLDVLSRPYILASDNQLASITVGQEVPFITDSRITDTGQTINTIEYDDVGILLDVIPHINPDGLVILDVAPEISALTGTTVPISELVSAPVIAKRSALTRVGVRNGKTVVIGGLMEDRLTQTIRQVPFIGSIPYLGELFKRREMTKNKTELLIFLTPHVASNPEMLEPMSDDEVGGTRLVPHAVAPGIYDAHRAGLERGRTPTTNPATQPIEGQ